MPDGIFVSGTISGIEFVYAGAIYMARIDHLYQFPTNLSTKMVSDGNAGYCIPDARYETTFRHSFWHWFNFFQGNLQDQKCKKWSFLPIYDVFEYRWHLIEMPDNAYQMQDVRWVFSIVSGIDLMDAGAISVPEMPKKSSHISHLECNIQHFHWIAFVLKYIQHRFKWSICCISGHVNCPGIN